MLNDKGIRSCLSRFDIGAYSRLQFLRAVSHSVGAHTESLQPRDDNSSSSSSSEDEDKDRQAPMSAATTSGASESATTAAATTSAHCLVASRAGFALVPCGHARFCEAYSMRLSVKRAGQLSLPYVGIASPERNRTAHTCIILPAANINL